jgi:hypothetical protein
LIEDESGICREVGLPESADTAVMDDSDGFDELSVAMEASVDDDDRSPTW